MMKNAGPHGTITSLTTPFRLGGIDQNQLASLVDRQVLNGIDGILVCDPSGEGFALSDRERDDLISAAVAATRNRIPTIVATGTNCTSKTIELTVRAAELGAAAVLITVPYYSKPGEAGIVQHFHEIAAATTIPIIIDDDPIRTASRLSVRSLAALGNFPSIVGIRHSHGEIATFLAIPTELKERYIHYSGHDQTALAFLMSGGSSVFSRTANLVPQLISSLQRAAIGLNVSAALSIHHRLQPLMSALGDFEPPSIKYALLLLTGCNADVRCPLVPVDRDAAEAIAAALAPYFAFEDAFNTRRHSLIWG